MWILKFKNKRLAWLRLEAGETEIFIWDLRVPAVCKTDKSCFLDLESSQGRQIPAGDFTG